MRANIVRKATSHVLQQIEGMVNQSTNQGPMGDKCGNDLWLFPAFTRDPKNSCEHEFTLLGSELEKK